jgi:5-methylcytosine-specific restriction enzyme subunit McrC
MTLVEYGPLAAWTPAEIDMDEGHAAELAKTRMVRVEPVAPPSRWRLIPDSRVGVLVGDGWELRIRPKLDVPKLLFLLGYSEDPKGWADVIAGFREVDELLDALAAGFAWHATRALAPGPLYGYVHVDEREIGLRGRIRFGDQLARLPGLPIPIEISYDDFTANVPENRILLTASELLLRLPRVPTRARERLLHIRSMLDGVETYPVRSSIVRPEATRLNERYAAALTLAMLVIKARATALESGDVSSSTFLFDMNEVFESFLFAALSDAFLRRHSGRLERHHIAYLDTAGEGIQLKPDITWHSGGACRAVVDAKYKSLVDKKTMPNADAYQMLAYCIGLGLARGFLVYAKDSGEKPSNHTVKQHGYEIVVRSIDVEKEPRELLDEVGALSDEIASQERHPAIRAA